MQQGRARRRRQRLGKHEENWLGRNPTAPSQPSNGVLASAICFPTAPTNSAQNVSLHMGWFLLGSFGILKIYFHISTKENQSIYPLK